MSVGPQLQLAVLWPWLLMATLQIRLGYSGLALVAAERASAQKAVIRVIPLKMDPLTLEGVFASVAEVTPAEGKLLQFHPLSLCNTSEDEHTVPGFISIVKLERPERNLHPCLSLANKAKLAGERGARAVLFDISDDQAAADQLKEPRGLSHPVVLIWGQDAERLMGVVNNNREAHVKIEVKEAPEWPDYDLWILLTVVSTVVVIISVFIIRTRCHTSRAQTNVQEETLQAISQLATRTYQARRRQAPSGDAVSTCSSAPVCAICLEEFNEGQELRIITCFHEFHRQCVDPWLQQHQTCPLCMFNIISKNQEHSIIPVRSRENPHSLGPGRRQRHFLRQHPGRALYHFPRTLSQRPPRNCPSRLPHNHPFFHSPELSQLDFGTMRYLPSRSAGLDPLHCHQPPPTRGLLAAQRQETLRGEQAWAPHRSCLLRHQPSSQGLGVNLPAKLSRAVNLQRGIRHGRHPHHSSGSGESYFTEPSGYIPDGPGSDSSSGPCHGSSSDSVLNCTDVSLQALHGSCSTFHSSLSSDYDPFAFCSSEKVAVESHPNQPAPHRDLRPPVLDVVVPGRAQLASSHVHYHHHHHRHHHYGRNPPEYPSDRSSQEPGQRKAKYARAKTGPQSGLMQKQTEKVQTQGGGSSSQDASLVRPSSCLPQGLKPYLAATSDLTLAARGQTGDVGPQTPQKHYLQIPPSRGKWKGPLDASQSPLSKDPYIIPSCHAPAPSDPTSGNCCSLEMQPLLVSTNQSTHRFVCAPQHSAPQPGMLELQEQVDIQRETDCDKPMFPGQISGRDPSGNNTSVYLNCQILQHLQGVKENLPDIYEHSV